MRKRGFTNAQYAHLAFPSNMGVRNQRRRYCKKFIAFPGTLDRSAKHNNTTNK